MMSEQKTMISVWVRQTEREGLIGLWRDEEVNLEEEDVEIMPRRKNFRFLFDLTCKSDTVGNWLDCVGLTDSIGLGDGGVANRK